MKKKYLDELTINRSAKTGKFVTAKKAKKSPSTTVKETIEPYKKHSAAIRVFIKRVAMGQSGELKGQFIANITKQANDLMRKLYLAFD